MTHTSRARTPEFANGAVQAKAAKEQRQPAQLDPRWRIRNDLDRARPFYDGINAQHVAVLSCLLSFMGPKTRIVFASNKSLCLRLHSMPERTLRRHLERLQEEGFITRHSSPNGKRWAIRKPGGEIDEAYGLDLTPFFERAQEFAQKAAEVLRRNQELAAARRRLSLLRRDLLDLGTYTELLKEIERERKRVPCPASLSRYADLERRVKAALVVPEEEQEQGQQTPFAPDEMTAKASQNGRHQQTRDDRLFSLGSTEAPARQPDCEGKIFREIGGQDAPEAAPPSEAESAEAATEGSGSPEGDPASCESTQSRDSLQDHVQRVLTGFRNKLHAQRRRSFREEPDPASDPDVQIDRGQPFQRMPSTATEDHHLGDPAAGSVLNVDRGQLGEQTTCSSEHAELFRRAPAAPEDEVDRGQPLRRRLSDDYGPDRVRSVWTRPPAASGRQAPSRPLTGQDFPSLEAVLAACPETLSFTADRPRTWSQLFEESWRIAGMIGIGERILVNACVRLGREGLAITIFCLCQRHHTIREPAAYLRSLCQRADFRPAELLAGLGRASPA